MSKFLNKNYSLSDFPKHKKRLISWIENAGYFSVSIGPWFSIFGISKRERLKIYRNVLDKFISLATVFYVYDLNYDLDIVKPFHKNLLRDHSRYKINFENNGWSMFDSLVYSPTVMRSITEIRGGIIGKCKLDDATLTSIFEHCCDPIVVGNANTSCGKNALSLAKKSNEDGIFYVIIETLNRGLESITLISNRTDILHIFDIASHSCRISKNYRKFKIAEYDYIFEKLGIPS
jgi:hypothetical protein